MTRAADELANALAALCRRWGYRRIEMAVGGDGAVTFTATCPRGYVVGRTHHASVPEPGLVCGDPAPSIVLARWPHEMARPIVADPET